MAGIEQALEAGHRYIIKRPRLTRLLDEAGSRVLMLIAPAGFGKTTLAREWVADRRHAWYRGTPATSDIAALVAGLATLFSETLGAQVGERTIARMRAAGAPADEVESIAELFAEELSACPADLWLVFDDYHFAMEAEAPEAFMSTLLERSSIRLLLTSRRRPSWASARGLLYGDFFELGRNDLAMDQDEAGEVLSHREDVPAAGLVALAEGWPAVIGLAALTNEVDVPEITVSGALYDFFAEELFQAATPLVRRGLQRLSIAPTLGDGVAEFILGPDVESVTSEGVRLGFLTRRADAFDFHPLLRTFLQTKPQEREDAEETASQLASFLAAKGSWDDAFTLVDQLSSDDLYLELLERGLRPMLDEARIATLVQWVAFGRARHLDDPIIDLAEAELAMTRGEKERAEGLAARAAKRFPSGHPATSRAYYIAGMSAHLTYNNHRSADYFRSAISAATTRIDQREAAWGQLAVSLDLQKDDVDDLLNEIVALDDGSAISDVRLATVQFQIAVRQGSVHDCTEAFERARQVIDRVTDTHVRSSFSMLYAAYLTVLGRYAAATKQVRRAEVYLKQSRLPFAVPYLRRVNALAELGLRNFSRAKQLVDQLERDGGKDGNAFLSLEGRLIRSRLLVAQGFAPEARKILFAEPDGFPFVDERAEYLATLALAEVCAGDINSALQHADEAAKSSRTVEVSVLCPCVRAIATLMMNEPSSTSSVESALEAVRRTGNADSLVVAYRGYPGLLPAMAERPEWLGLLEQIVTEARDWRLAKLSGLAANQSDARRHTPLSKREQEVLDLVSQGLTNREIARSLFISEATVKVHVRHVLEKLGVRSRTQAALVGKRFEG